uniref:AlNc14C38G3306 protein n=1 Tax=Albugo laibachii Nc14 TaxID=890382 RepID=F0W935_9STRA|nr:AlNc14C38G3306 [Albugo laibachii Nc14]|eukprot:CCA17647.1 AlNc14C38G3306 [Albugo laibachii Nc14]
MSDFETAEVELASNTKKMHLPLFGQMPFLLAYAAANSWVQFFVIDSSLNMSRISQKLNLMDLTGRIQCVLSSINVCRILYHYEYESMLPRGYLPMYKEMPRNNGTVTLCEDHVLKKLNYDPYDFKAVIAVYEAIRQNQIVYNPL